MKKISAPSRAAWLAALLFCAAAGAGPAPCAFGGVCEEALPDLRLRSAEAYREALEYELRKEPAGRAVLTVAGPFLAAAAREGAAAGDPTQAELFEAMAGALTKAASGAQPAARAAAAAREYLSPAALRAVEAAEVPPPLPAPPDLVVLPGGSAEAAARPEAAAWAGADAYAASRIGPLTALLDRLDGGDSIVLSNLPIAAQSVPSGAKLKALHLPISGYAKKVWLAEGAGGADTLYLTDFEGRVYLRHFELLLRRYCSGRSCPAPRLAESAGAYAPRYRSLAALCEKDRPACSGLETVIAGYGEAFRIHWSSWSVLSLTDGDWRLDLYGPDGRGRWGVVTARSSFYGETLGESLAALVAVSSGVKTAVLAGSGGSLEARPFYSVVYPSHVLPPGAAPVVNALGSEADFRAHVSVVSPLEETPGWLGAALAKGVSTVDVEMGPAAARLSALGLRLGFAVLVTDFPKSRPVMERAASGANLASQDPGAKYRNIGEYALSLGAWLAGGVPPGWQPVEKKMGMPLARRSAANLAAEERRLSPFSGAEKRLIRKLSGFFRASPPAFSVRMSRARAERVLEDGAFLSTALVEGLKGSAVKPFTPDYEQRSYGALSYIFGTLSYWDGPEKYGDTVLRIREKTWRRRAWATRRSGMRALALTAEKRGLTLEAAEKDPSAVAEAEELFFSWIVTPEDLPGALALQVVGELRALPRAALAEFLRCSPAEIPGLIKKHDVGWLEGRLWEAAFPEDIDLLKATAPVPEALERAAKALGARVAAFEADGQEAGSVR
ncbi:MAG: hypothetical protein PHV33_05850 [Elusimicrobiales bacterium]|nr:hypothetical protein [Elusimicrobiales bacterium]